MTQVNGHGEVIGRSLPCENGLVGVVEVWSNRQMMSHHKTVYGKTWSFPRNGRLSQQGLTTITRTAHHQQLKKLVSTELAGLNSTKDIAVLFSFNPLGLLYGYTHNPARSIYFLFFPRKKRFRTHFSAKVNVVLLVIAHFRSLLLSLSLYFSSFPSLSP